MTSTETITATITGERADFLETLNKHRHFLRFTTRDLTDEQAAKRTTASALCLGGLIKHVTEAEDMWMKFVLDGAEAMGGVEQDWNAVADGEWDAAGAEDGEFGEWDTQFRMVPGETLAGLLARYDEVAARTDEIVASLPDLNVSHPLPKAPWFEPDACWSARRVLLHVIAEIAQHAGHADIIRESLDGARSMG